MHWGKGIIVILAVFILFISGMSIYMFMAPADDYDHQYYEKGLAFNHDYDREAQVVKDHARPLIVLVGHLVRLTFAQPVKGKIKFMRPDDNTLDKAFNLNSGTGNEVELATDKFTPGQWQLELQWQSNHKDYLYHQEVYIK
jgi:nitrogen fixation protein FixH